ncbi:MAG: hypothetical protein IJV64_09595, partial [Oscillospiraceae bacterium]|nr:hypothetical protein [Oscillospiraceae bacterium]
SVEACEKLFSALQSIPPREPVSEAPVKLCQPKRILTPRRAMLSLAEALPVEQAFGRVLASPGISCPPAVPILVCGEEVDETAIRAFRYYGIGQIEVTT